MQHMVFLALVAAKYNSIPEVRCMGAMIWARVRQVCLQQPALGLIRRGPGRAGMGRGQGAADGFLCGVKHVSKSCLQQQQAFFHSFSSL